MLDGLWHTFRLDGAYVGYFETNISETRLFVGKTVLEQISVDVTLLLLGAYDKQSRKIKVIGKGKTASNKGFLEIEVLRNELTDEEKAHLTIP